MISLWVISLVVCFSFYVFRLCVCVCMCVCVFFFFYTVFMCLCVLGILCELMPMITKGKSF